MEPLRQLLRQPRQLVAAERQRRLRVQQELEDQLDRNKRATGDRLRRLRRDLRTVAARCERLRRASEEHQKAAAVATAAATALGASLSAELTERLQALEDRLLARIDALGIDKADREALAGVLGDMARQLARPATNPGSAT